MPTDAARQYDASSRALRICCVAASKKKSCVAFGGSGSFHACSAVHGLHTAWGGVALVSAVRHAGSLWSAQPRCSLPICHVLKMIEAFAPPGTVLIGALPAVSPKENNCCALPLAPAPAPALPSRVRPSVRHTWHLDAGQPCARRALRQIQRKVSIVPTTRGCNRQGISRIRLQQSWRARRA